MAVIAQNHRQANFSNLQYHFKKVWSCKKLWIFFLNMTCEEFVCFNTSRWFCALFPHPYLWYINLTGEHIGRTLQMDPLSIQYLTKCKSTNPQKSVVNAKASYKLVCVCISCKALQNRKIFVKPLSKQLRKLTIKTKRLIGTHGLNFLHCSKIWL